MKNTGVKTLFAAAVVAVSLSACHCSANDNTSRPGVNDENGRNVGNSEITENFSAGSDTNPNNDMYDGISGNLHGEPKSEGGHDQHEGQHE
ncbi:MAG: hypothetical protein JWO44_1929 [Bacteroidetes bacterium]|jgi:predicted component of type VI protein secretion system|nr:hypothetical protein [Bacteroidota bacterium]